MKPGQRTRSLIQYLHPGREALVDRGLSESSDFRELCEDYRRCFVALENLRQSGATAKSERILEYEELLAQLALEIEATLEASMQSQD
jgi:hypothetical protein